MTPEEKLKALGLTLPAVPTPVANYVPFRLDGKTVNLIFPGRGRANRTVPSTTRKVGRDVTWEQAYEHAKLVGLGLLAAAQKAAGGLDKVEVLKVLGMVNAIPELAITPRSSTAVSGSVRRRGAGRSRPARAFRGRIRLAARNITVEIEAVMRIV